MKNLIVLSLLLFPVLSFASGKLLENKAIQATVIEANAHLKQELTEEIKQSIGLDQFVLKVETKIDEKRLQAVLGVNEEDWNKLQGLSLPGLFVEGKEGYASSSLRQAKKEDILMSLRGLKIDLVYYQTSYKPEFLKETITQIMAFNYPLLRPEDVEINPTLNVSPHRAMKPQETLAEALKKPLTVNVLESLKDKYNKYIMIVAGVLLLIVGLFVAHTLKGSMGRLADVIKNKTFGVSGGGAQASAPKAESEVPPPFHPGLAGNTFESYVQATEYLTAMVEKEPKLSHELVLLKLTLEDFLSVSILMDVFSKEKRDLIMANIDAEKKEQFRAFVTRLGTAALKDDAQLKYEAVKLIRVMKMASLAPGELPQILITDRVSTMGLMEIGAFLNDCTEAEKAFMCEQLDSHQLAYLIQNGALAPKDMETEFSQLSKSEMNEFLKKIGAHKNFKRSVHKEKLESVYAQVETDKAEAIADALGLAPSLRFEFLFTNFKDSALKYLQAMDFESLSSLFPLLTESMKSEVLKELPELLSERLRFARKNTSADSLKLKGKFYFYLRTLSDHEEDKVTHSKLAA